MNAEDLIQLKTEYETLQACLIARNELSDHYLRAVAKLNAEIHTRSQNVQILFNRAEARETGDNRYRGQIPEKVKEVLGQHDH